MPFTAISAFLFTKSASSVRVSRFVDDLAAFVDFALRCFIAELSLVCLYKGELIVNNLYYLSSSESIKIQFKCVCTQILVEKLKKIANNSYLDEAFSKCTLFNKQQMTFRSVNSFNGAASRSVH